MSQMSRIIRMARSSRGQSLVEFAMVLPLLLVIAFIITEFGRALWVQNVLTQAAGAGARAASVATTATYQTKAEEGANRILSASNMSTTAQVGAATVTSSLVDVVGGTGVKVRVTREFSFIPSGGAGDIPTSPFAKTGSNSISLTNFTIAGEAIMKTQPSFN